MQLTLDALKEAAAWPGADRGTRVLLAGQFLADERYEEGFGYFAAQSAAQSGDVLALALAGAFESHLDGRAEAAIAKLDAAAGLDLGLPQFFRGTALAGLPGCAGRAETAAADLELVLAVKDQFPPGLLRAAYAGLAHAYQVLGRTQEAEAAQSRSGQLTTDYWANPEDGFRFAPPRFAEVAPGVYVAQNYDFSDFGFVVTADGIVAIDAASSPEHAAAALRELRKITDLPVTHVILTHAHFDHVGGLGALTGDGAVVIAQANFASQLENQNSGPTPFRYLWPFDNGHVLQVAPDRLVSQPETLSVGGVEFALIPVPGGETDDGLVVHLPDRGIVFAGDMAMPYLGAPFFAEGSAEGLFEAMEMVIALQPRLLVHGHSGLTESYTIEAFPGLLAALRELNDVVKAGIANGLAVVDILAANHLPQVLKDHPLAVIPYLVTRDNFIRRVYHQRAGWWHPADDGELFPPAELAAAVDLVGGGTVTAFSAAATELTKRREHALALRILDLGLLSHPGAPELVELRADVLGKLVAKHQALDSFKFAYYAGLIDLELAPAG
jgi:glyoxylase-like metal-dependent hydrolase (beta-lactamase superfamily II)